MDIDNKVNEEDELEEEDDEDEFLDYFSNINFEKKQPAAQVPPQNSIIPRKRKLYKGKFGSKSFRQQKAKPKEEEKDDYKIELI